MLLGIHESTCSKRGNENVFMGLGILLDGKCDIEGMSRLYLQDLSSLVFPCVKLSMFLLNDCITSMDLDFNWLPNFSSLTIIAILF